MKLLQGMDSKIVANARSPDDIEGKSTNLNK